MFADFILIISATFLIIGLARELYEPDVGTRRAVSAEKHNTFSKPIYQSISTIVGAYKSTVTMRINLTGGHGVPCPYEKFDIHRIWQSRFHDHIIRT